MGVADPRKCGTFRKMPVHVGDPDVLFAPPSLIPEMMKEFCRKFPTILPTTVKYDPILKAAEASYKFVRIHPYHDGNSRVSRLLMNLVLCESKRHETLGLSNRNGIGGDLREAHRCGRRAPNKLVHLTVKAGAHWRSGERRR